MRTIGVVTTSRADYGHLTPLLRALEDAPDLQLWLYVSGMHLAPEFGDTVRQIDFPIRERIPMLEATDMPAGTARSMSRGVAGFAEVFAREKPDVLVLFGDRFEMLAAGMAALPFRLPLAHLHGGELTEGAMDEVSRHALTKMSHLHFAATETYRRRIIQMGEAPERVFHTGGPGLDNLRGFTPDSPLFDEPFLLITFHPVTLGETAPQFDALLAALEEEPRPILFTFPNVDPDHQVIIERMHAFAVQHPRAKVVKNLGSHGYFSAMAHAAAMLGNSSSGIVEAASFRLPVIDIGERQRGRLAAENVIHVEPTKVAIQAGLQRALSLDLSALVNPYGNGHASERIVKILREAKLGPALLAKRFHDLSGEH